MDIYIYINFHIFKNFVKQLILNSILDIRRVEADPMTLDQGLGVTHIVAIVDLGQDLVQGVTEDIPALDRTHDPGLDPEVVHPLSQEDKVLLLFSTNAE